MRNYKTHPTESLDTLMGRFNAVPIFIIPSPGGWCITQYFLRGKDIVRLENGDHDMQFFYDAHGKPAIVRYASAVYGYVYNLQGDVIGIVDKNGTSVVEYKYDAWGKIISKTGSMAATWGTYNPFRYRGYVYDEETGLYYLRSRYYNPEWCRFVSADSYFGKVGETLSHNLFAYCKGNPVDSKDTNGFKEKVLTYNVFEPFDGEDWGTHSSKLPASVLIANCITIAHEGDWIYKDKTLQYKLIDCIGIIVLSAKFWFTEPAFENQFKVELGTDSAKTHNMDGSMHPITAGGLRPGHILYTADEGHVGVYIGAYISPDNEVILDAVVHASSSKGRVIIQSLTDPSCPFVKYCEYDYIDYDMSYADSVVNNSFSFQVREFRGLD